MWEAILYIGTPLALIACIVAAVSNLFEAKFTAELKQLEGIQGEDKVNVIKALERVYHLNQSLSNDQKFQLILQHSKIDLDKDKSKLRWQALIAILLFALSAFAFYKTASEEDKNVVEERSNSTAMIGDVK